VYYHHKFGLYYRNGAPFTGQDFWSDDDFEGVAEFQDGRRLRARAWSRSGTPAYDFEYRHKLLHGRRQMWHDNGTLAEDGECEYGVLLWFKQWDAEGRLLEDTRLKETDPEYEKLQTLRRQSEAGGPLRGRNRASR
jgi:hypothetical protein